MDACVENNKVYEKNISSMVTVARVFALISVVCAHITFPETVPEEIRTLYSSLGSVGVIFFFIAAGYYYNPKKYTFIALLKNKFISVCLPWLFFGSIYYVYKAILKPGEHLSLSFGAYFKWIIGHETFLYFCTILLLCFLIFYRTNKPILISSVVITFISVMLTASGMWKPIIEALHITDYLNIFNWAGFFALGMLLKLIPAHILYNFVNMPPPSSSCLLLLKR